MKDHFVIKVGLILIAILCGLFTGDIYAKDCDVMGETYPIKEIDFLDFIQSRIEAMLKNGQWQSLQNRVQQNAIHYRDRPMKVVGISRARETKNWKFDPSIVLDHDVTTSDGKIIAIAGTYINSLSYITLSKALIFYDGDDKEQVKWVIEQDKKLKGRDKLVLVNGSVLLQEKQFRKPIYFDQSGTLTSRFGIKHVPAYVIQEGLVLRITEVNL